MSCDHVVAFYHEWDSTEIIKLSDLPYRSIQNDNDGYDLFNYCPNCGERIDWDLIKREAAGIV